MRHLQMRGRYGFAAVAAAFLFMSGVAQAHPLPVPAPTGPINTYYAEDGMFGVFCAQAYVEVSHVGSYEGEAQTRARYSPSGLCSAWLPQDAGNLYAYVMVKRPNNAVCDYASGYNQQGGYLVLVDTGSSGCYTGQAYSYGNHQSWMYSFDSHSWTTPTHASI